MKQQQQQEEEERNRGSKKKKKKKKNDEGENGQLSNAGALASSSRHHDTKCDDDGKPVSLQPSSSSAFQSLQQLDHALAGSARRDKDRLLAGTRLAAAAMDHDRDHGDDDGSSDGGGGVAAGGSGRAGGASGRSSASLPSDVQGGEVDAFASHARQNTTASTITLASFSNDSVFSFSDRALEQAADDLVHGHGSSTHGPRRCQRTTSIASDISM